MEHDKTYKQIASLLVAIDNCQQSDNATWERKHQTRLDAIMDAAPSGSGVDNGTELLASSTPERLKFRVDYHHMNDAGMYDGWTDHVATVKPSLAFDIDISISGRDRNDTKNYLGDVLDTWLHSVPVEYLLEQYMDRHAA